jgi:predicted phosphohydrolase
MKIIDRTELDNVISSASKAQKQQEEKEKTYKNMLEELDSSVQRKIEKQVFKLTQDFRQSPFQEDVVVGPSSSVLDSQREI